MTRKVTVPAACGMDTVIFYKHFNLRHMPMAGLQHVPSFSRENGATVVLRQYHERLHEEDPDGHDHYHNEEE